MVARALLRRELRGGWQPPAKRPDGRQGPVDSVARRRRPLVLAIAATVLAAAGTLGCESGLQRDDARERVVDMIKSAELPGPLGLKRLTLPPALAIASDSGEVMTLREGQALTVVFFDFRGLNHYRGSVYSERPLETDPLGNSPFKATRVADNWYTVEAG